VCFVVEEAVAGG